MVKIYKLTGTGNHFLLIDLRASKARKDFQKYFRGLTRKKIVRQLCNPFQSIGADGLLFLENSTRADYKWDFYNADGSSAEMCGNAARCVGRYIASGAKPPRDFTLETKAGVIRIVLPLKKTYKFTEPALIEVEMPKLSAYQAKQSVKVGGKNIKFDFINSGVPHAVVQLPRGKNLKSILKNVDNLVHIVNKIRALNRFKKSSTNVTFYTQITSNRIESLTFERGVDGYTQACGTGAVAAAVSYTKNQASHTEVKVPGGLLLVDLNFKNPHLIGLGELVAEIYLK